MFRKTPQDTLPPVDGSNDFRSLEIGEKVGNWVGAIVGAATLAAAGYLAYQDSEAGGRSTETALVKQNAAHQAESGYREGVDPECGRLLLAYRSDLITQPDETIPLIVNSGLCGKEGATIAKVASNFAIATAQAEKSLADKKNYSTNYPAYVLGGLVAGPFFGGLARGGTSFGVFCVLAGISDRKNRKYYEKSSTMLPGADWKPPIQDRL